MLTTTEAYDDAALTALLAAATLLGADLKAGLFTNNVNPTPLLTIADLTEPTYAGYVRQAVVMGAGFRDPRNGIAAMSAGLIWQEAGALTPVIVKGIFYTYGVGPALLGVEVFPQPIGLNDHLDAFTSILEYIQTNGNAGFSTIIR